MKLLIIGTQPHPTSKAHQMVLDNLQALGYDVEYKQVGDQYEGLTITHAVLEEYRNLEKLFGGTVE